MSSVVGIPTRVCELSHFSRYLPVWEKGNDSLYSSVERWGENRQVLPLCRLQARYLACLRKTGEKTMKKYRTDYLDRYCELCAEANIRTLATTKRWTHEAFGTVSCRYIALCTECAVQWDDSADIHDDSLCPRCREPLLR